MDLRVRTAIEIKKYGDYDSIYTECIMVSPDVRDTDDIVKRFCNLNAFPNVDGTGLPTNMIDDATDDFIKYLKKEGFKELDTNQVIFSD